MKRFVVLVALLTLFAAACARMPKPESFAVTVHAAGGIIDGVVTDSSGAALPGVVMTVTDASGRTFAAVTDANGNYRFHGLAAGVHSVTARLSGMSTQSVRVTAASNERVTVHTVLNVASVAESISVTAEAPMLGKPGSHVVRPNEPVPVSRRGEKTSVAAPAVATPAAPAVVTAGYLGQVAVAEPPPVQREEYSAISEHDFHDAKEQPVTTFSIDVDRASYSNVRRFLANGAVPPADAVRIEELVNYFTYRYPQPRDGRPFSIDMEVVGCPWNSANRLLRIGIQGQNLDEWRSAPNNLVFLLDVSGSMAPPERLPLLKSAFRVLVDKLRAEDKVAIVVYAGAAGLVLPPTSGADKRAILESLDRLGAGGSTAGASGIDLAYKVALQNYLPKGNNRVILATDGDFNVGISDLKSLEAFIEDKRKSGVFLTTIGVGSGNYRDAVLETLADKGNGNYSYLDTQKEADKVFRQEFLGTIVAIAKDVKVQLEFDPRYVASYRQVGYENRALANEDFDDDTKDAGELGAGHSVTALYEIVPASNARGTLATVKLRYKEPKSEQSQLIVHTATDRGKSAFEASADTQWAAAVAQFGMLLRKSKHRGTATFADVLQLARIARGEDLDGLREEFIRLADTARAISGEAPPAIAGK